MLRILIPTNDEAIVPDITQGYQDNGCEVVAGVCNMWMRSFQPDVIHFLWPEEFSHWEPPNKATFERIESALDHWCNTAPSIFSVNNLFPHGYEGNLAFRDLYSMFLEKSHVVLHHSEASRRLIQERYSAACRKDNHIVSSMFAYDRFLNPTADRSQIRSNLGLHEGEFAYLTFGGLRSVDETELIKRAFNTCDTPNKRLVMAGRFQPRGSMLRKRLQTLMWQHWLNRSNALHGFGFIPDDELHRYFMAADAIVIPRLDDLSSGVVGLGMTFGKPIIAPDHGAFPDYLTQTPNLLYTSGCAKSMGAKMTEASRLDPRVVLQVHREIAETWTWKRIAADGLRAIGVRQTLP